MPDRVGGRPKVGCLLVRLRHACAERPGFNGMMAQQFVERVPNLVLQKHGHRSTAPSADPSDAAAGTDGTLAASARTRPTDFGAVKDGLSVRGCVRVNKCRKVEAHCSRDEGECTCGSPMNCAVTVAGIDACSYTV